MKRFYKDTAVDAGEGGFRVLLDGKPMRTPAKATLVVPTRALAEAIAAEWAGVPDKAEINAAHLPLTRLAATGIDRVVARREEVIADTAKYARLGPAVLSRHRAGQPGQAAARSLAAAARLGGRASWRAPRYRRGHRLRRAAGRRRRPNFSEAVSAHGDLALSALYNLTHTAGSLVVIALAVSEGRLRRGRCLCRRPDSTSSTRSSAGATIRSAEKHREGVRTGHRGQRALPRAAGSRATARMRG